MVERMLEDAKSWFFKLMINGFNGDFHGVPANEMWRAGAQPPNALGRPSHGGLLDRR